mgnify:CR=1 FL=1
MEKNEVASQVRSKLKSFSREQQLINTLDSLNQELFRSLQQIGIDSMRTDSVIRRTRSKISEQIALNQYGEYLKNVDTTKLQHNEIIPVADSKSDASLANCPITSALLPPLKLLMILEYLF